MTKTKFTPVRNLNVGKTFQAHKNQLCRKTVGGKGLPLSLMKKMIGSSNKPHRNSPCNSPCNNPAISTSSSPNNNQPTKRYRPGAIALREIREYQKRTDRLIPKVSFYRIVREIIRDRRHQGFFGEYKMTQEAMTALQESAEMHLSDLFSLSQVAAIHGRRITVTPKDMHLAMRIAMKKSAPCSSGSSLLSLDIASDLALGDGSGA